MLAVLNMLRGAKLAAQAAAPVDPAARVFASVVTHAEQRTQAGRVDAEIDRYAGRALRPMRATRRR